MAASKEIKVVLSLDDAGFTVKTKTATDVVKTLEGSLGNMAKTVVGAEKSLDDITSGLKSFNDGFGALNKSLKGVVDGVNKTVASLADLNKATADGAKAAKDSATQVIDARLKTLNNELEANRRTLASRQELRAQMLRVENDYNARALAQSIAAENIRRQKRAGSSRAAQTEQNVADGYYNSASVVRQEISSIERLIERKREEINLQRQKIELAEKERAVIAYVAEANRAAGEAARFMGQEERAAMAEAANARRAADAESAAAARQVARQRISAAREAAAEERRQAEMVGQMWRSMAQLYGASQIKEGLRQSVNQADDYARTIERLDSMGIDGVQGKQNALSLAKQVENANPNLSKTDAMKLTMSGLAGTVSSDTKSLGAVLPEIAKVLTVMTRQFPEQTHNLEDFGRNVMGVMEARGITQDPKKMLDTLDNLARALALSGGKMTVQDYETISRRGGAGNAQLKDNDSILFDVAAASQMKVMGGSGGGAGGVSSFATMQKQAAKRASGGTRETIAATENLVEFGVIDRETLMAANGNKPLGKNYKTVAYANSDMAADNMTKFAMDLVNKVKAKLAALPETDARFFAKGVDRTDDAEQAKAFGRWADKSIGNTNVAEFYKSFASKGAQERINMEVDKSKAAPGYSADHERAMKSWGMAVETTKASLEKLGVVVGDVIIPVLQPMLGVVTNIIDGLKKLGEESPVAAKLGVIAAAGAGVTLSFRGMMGMFGAVSNVSNGLAALASAAGRTTTAAEGLAGATGRVSAQTMAGLQATARSTAAQNEFAQMQLRAAQATVQNSTGMQRLAAVTNTLIPAQNNAAAAATAATTAQTALETAQRASTTTARAMQVGQRALAGALNLVGGPIGAIILGLTLATMAWNAFGTAASEAQRKAKKTSEDSAKAVQDAIKRVKDETRQAQAGENAPIRDTEEAEIAKLREKLVVAKELRTTTAEAQKSAKAGTELQAYNRAEAARTTVTDLEKEITSRETALRELIRQEAARAKQRVEDEKLAEEKAKTAAAKALKNAKSAMGAGSKLAGGDDDEDTGTVSVDGLFKKPVEHEKVNRVDPLQRALETAQGKVKANIVALAALKEGVETAEDIRQEVIAELEGRRKAGDFNVNRDKDKPVSANDPRYKALQEAEVTLRIQKEQKKALEYANERVAATNVDLEAAMQRVEDGAPKQSEAFRALERELARTEQRLGLGATAFDGWNEAKSRALANRALTDGKNYTEDLRNRNRSDAADLLETDAERKEARLRDGKKGIARFEAEYKAKAALIIKQRDIELAAMEEAGARHDEIAARRAQIDKDLADMEIEQNERRRIDAERLRRINESATASMVREWKDVGKAVDDIGASAANSFVSMLTSSLGSGRMEVGQFVKGVMLDIANAKMKQSLADPLKEVVESGAGWVKKNIFGLGGDAASTAAETAKTTAVTASTVATTASTTALGLMAISADNAALAMSMLASSAGAQGFSGLGSLLGAIGGGESGGMFGSITGAASMEGLPNFAGYAANGGILTSSGFMELRKYANGGVANSPQVAIYGEAGPEAYVPLPDGRTIPVTMTGGQGGNAPSVQVNVINQTSQPVNAQQGGVRFDGKQYILDVVMTAASTPGAFRSGLKDAVK